MKQISILVFICLFLSACTGEQNVLKVTPENIATSLSSITSGSTIRLEAKKYVLNAPILIDGKENITIEGNGAILVMNSLSENVIHISNSKGLVLKNLKATHIEPSGPTGCTGNVIYMDNSDDVVVEKCDLNGSGIVGIAAYNVSKLKITNNHIHENSKYGIIYMGPSVEITSNTFEKNAQGHLYYSFIAKDAPTSWPPKELLNKDISKEGLTMNTNIYK